MQSSASGKGGVVILAAGAVALVIIATLAMVGIFPVREGITTITATRTFVTSVRTTVTTTIFLTEPPWLADASDYVFKRLESFAKDRGLYISDNILFVLQKEMALSSLPEELAIRAALIHGGVTILEAHKEKLEKVTVDYFYDVWLRVFVVGRPHPPHKSWGEDVLAKEPLWLGRYPELRLLVP